MDMLLQLWLPILLAAAAVWFWNFLSWSILSIHRNDFAGLPDEDAVMTSLRGMSIAPGTYVFPRAASNAECKSPEFQAKWKAGPAGLLSLWPSESKMGGKMIASFAVCLLVSLLVGYLGAAALDKGTGFAKAMQVLGTAGVLAYTMGGLCQAIWFNATRSAKFAMVIDGLVAGLATGAIFAALWPK
jgi:hypothetical protein